MGYKNSHAGDNSEASFRLGGGVRVGAEGGMSTHSIQERARDIFLFESRCHGFILQIQDETRSRTEIPLSMDFIIQEKKATSPRKMHTEMALQQLLIGVVKVQNYIPKVQRDGAPALHRRG